MTTVAPSAPAPVATDAPAGQGKGDSADPQAFAAEFESAVSSLAAATPTPSAGEPAAAPLAEASGAVSPLLVAPALAGAPAAATPAAPAAPAASDVPAAPDSTPAPPSEMTEATPLPGQLPADVEGVSLPISVISEGHGEGPGGGDADGQAGSGAAAGAAGALAGADAPVEGEPDSDAPDAPADVAAGAPASDLVLPLPLAPAPAAPAPAAPSSDALSSATPAAGPVGAPDPAAAPAAPVNAVDAAAPVAPQPAPAPALAPVLAAEEVAAPSRAQAPDLAGQLTRPISGLRSFGDGTHVITINVTPENLGPVAVRAHVSGDSMRIELVAPTDQARAAIKDILPDLRRDLSASGGQTTLDLSSGNQPSGRESAPREAPYSGGATGTAAPAAAAGIRTPTRSDAGLDVLA